ncbi:MAG: diaminopimelate epimerase [Gammaproteobacteria bacterium]|jgi:diaminopimelate epimerase|nr:diaminopimelate epimerase [Gammaproteobacteria bacterium]
MNETPSFDNPPSGRFFIKMHGLLNHFVIVDARNDAYSPSEKEIVRICDVRTGVGGDQLIVLEPPRKSEAAAFMRILNVDGREVEACGNATRCVAWLLLEELKDDHITLETLAGLIECRRTDNLEVSCTMGRVSMDWQDIPLAEEKDTSHIELGPAPLADGIALNIGNPHIVFFVDDIDETGVSALAPAIQQHDLFPNQVNVGFAQLLADDHLRSVVYERGAGLTTACGSGACVAAYAAIARGLTTKREMKVSMPAGDVRISIDDNDVATMTGPVAYCCSGYL